MSVTFWIPSAARRTVPCEYCEQGWCGTKYGCTGFREESTAPEVNFSNRNACLVLRAMGLPTDDDLCGSLSPNEADKLTEATFPPAYGGTHKRIDRLREVLRYSRDTQQEVVWG
jgi:hypothetical protein